jgi:16S rRNA (cytosine967-C5)-methyltransferase
MNNFDDGRRMAAEQTPARACRGAVAAAVFPGPALLRAARMAETMPGPRPVLIVDDDAALGATLAEQLALDGEFAPVPVADLASAEAALSAAGARFDAILLDAPCTASGIVRRHPDVRWLRRADDVHALAQVQAELLEALWPLLKPGGRLLYATCSVFRDEGSRQIDAFLQRPRPGAPRLESASPGHLLPTPDNAPKGVPARGAMLQDGFFYALMHKT